ncbi:YitT family protein [Mycoplasma leonicaptivi]|uniref:YitT family protein n=1 Tax=Mycoplasma leonicaptivi TaxID=36742 RepID=UPI000688E8F1|nr:YitT family protein [Mycoplasma leonicaptivi]
MKKDEKNNKTDCDIKIENTIENQNNEVEKLKYKMGKYLLNNQKVKWNTKIMFKRYWQRILLIFIAALIFNAGIQIFLSRAQTIPSGVTGIPTLLQNTIPATKEYFALIYLACNIPLFIIFGRKIKGSFIFLTLIFMFFQIITNFIFTLKVIDDALHKFITFTNESKPYTNWSSLIYSSAGAILIAVGISISWKAGGSTGGTDIIAYYFSTRSKKSVGTILSIIGIVTAILFLIIFAVAKPNYLYDKPIHFNEYKTQAELLTNNDYLGISIENKEMLMSRYNNLMLRHQESRIYFGMREICTFWYIVVTNSVINMLYPKYKKVEMTIISPKPEKVIAYFKLINYWHSYRIERYKSGYTV